MYHKKRLICTDISGKIIGTVTLSGDGEKLKIAVTTNLEVDEIFLLSSGVGKIYKLPTTEYFPYKGGNIGCLLIKDGSIQGLSKGGYDYPTLLSRMKLLIEPKPTNSNHIKEVSATSTIDEKTTIDADTADKIVDEKVEDVENQTTTTKPTVEREIAHFYCSIKSNLDETFTCYPTVESLEKLIPYSRWVEIKKEDTPYVVGLIKEVDTPRYVCYGVKSPSGNIPPEDVRDYCQWLPLDDYQGYWVIFQDADTGEVLKE